MENSAYIFAAEHEFGLHTHPTNSSFGLTSLAASFSSRALQLLLLLLLSLLLLQKQRRLGAAIAPLQAEEHRSWGGRSRCI